MQGRVILHALPCDESSGASGRVTVTPRSRCRVETADPENNITRRWKACAERGQRLAQAFERHTRAPHCLYQLARPEKTRKYCKSPALTEKRAGADLTVPWHLWNDGGLVQHSASCSSPLPLRFGTLRRTVKSGPLEWELRPPGKKRRDPVWPPELELRTPFFSQRHSQFRRL